MTTPAIPPMSSTTRRFHRVAMAPGEGWLFANAGGVVFVSGPGHAATSPAVEVHTSSTSAWELAARVLAGALGDGASQWTGFAVVAMTGAEPTVIARGVDVEVDGRRLSSGSAPGGEATGALTVVTARPDAVIVVGSGPVGEHAAASGDLVEGSVRAGGARLTPRAAESDPTSAVPGQARAPARPADNGQAPKRPPAPSQLGRGSGPVQTTTSERVRSFLAPAQPGAPTPGAPAGRPAAQPEGSAASEIVPGARCGRDHFNDPRARYCEVCGLAMRQAGQTEVAAPRPPLGVLVWDTGQTDQLDRDLVIGRLPGVDPRIASGRADGLVPGGSTAQLSRVHADIRLEGWEVVLVDRASSNGTFVWEAAASLWRRLAANEPLVLTAGTVIAFADRIAMYESGPSQS